MIGVQVSAPGAAQLGRDLDLAAQEINVDELVVEVATPIANRAQRAAPRLTGAMARSITVTPAGITVDPDYAVPVHYGSRYLAARPFLTTAIRDAEVVDLADRHLTSALDHLGTSYV